MTRKARALFRGIPSAFPAQAAGHEPAPPRPPGTATRGWRYALARKAASVPDAR